MHSSNKVNELVLNEVLAELLLNSTLICDCEENGAYTCFCEEQAVHGSPTTIAQSITQKLIEKFNISKKKV